MDWLVALEQIAPVRLLKTSFYAYPLVNAAHIVAIGGLFTSALLMDLRLLGMLAAMPEKPLVSLLRRVALVSFGFAVLTGVSLFAVRAAHYADLPVFLAKMALIGLAGLNFVAFTAVERRNGSGRRMLAFLSIILWGSVLVCGRFIGFV